MAVHYRTQGFFLKKVDRGEADQLFTIYTEDFGKLDILGRAVRKIKSKLRAGAELFYLSEIEFIQGKTHKTLTDTILIENFPNIRKDLARLKIVHQIAEITDTLVNREEKDERVWQLLKGVFKKLNSLEIRNLKLEILYYYFLWNFLSILGYQPELYKCCLCQKKLVPDKLYFSSKEGGVVCQSCFKKIKKAEKITSDTIKILRLIFKKDWNTLSKLKVEPVHQKSLTPLEITEAKSKYRANEFLTGLKNISKNYYSYVMMNTA